MCLCRTESTRQADAHSSAQTQTTAGSSGLSGVLRGPAGTDPACSGCPAALDTGRTHNEAIQQKSIAQQNADKQKIENEAAIAKAEADKQVAITNAEAEAQKTSIAADAQAEANRKLAESLSDTLIDYQKIQKWDGKGSTYFT